MGKVTWMRMRHLFWDVAFSEATNGNEQGVWMMSDAPNGSQPSSLTVAQQQ